MTLRDAGTSDWLDGRLKPPGGWQQHPCALPGLGKRSVAGGGSSADSHPKGGGKQPSLVIPMPTQKYM